MIFALPLYDDNPIRRPPLVTYVLIGMCVGAFLWELGQNGEVVAFQFGMIPARLFGHATLAPELASIPAWATIFTSMFIHGGVAHIGGNMLFLWIFGNNVEDLLGRGRYLLLYLSSGVVAALVQAASAPQSHIPMIGASGAIAGVLGAYIVTYPRANVHCFVWIVIFFSIVTVPAWIPARLVVRTAIAERAGGRPGLAGRRVLGTCRRLCQRHPALSRVAAVAGWAAAAAAHADLGDRDAARAGGRRPPHVPSRQRSRCRKSLPPPTRSLGIVSVGRLARAIALRRRRGAPAIARRAGD